MKSLAQQRSSRERRLAIAREWAYMANRDLGDELVEYEITPERLEELRTSLREQGVRGGLDTETLTAWIGNAALNCPVIDEVAIERGLNFDWPVIQAMTIDERYELYRRLSEMDDPWENKKSLLDEIIDDHAPSGSNRQGRPVSARRRAFLSAPEHLRGRMQGGLVRYMESAGVVA